MSIRRSQLFYEKYCDQKTYGKYHYLLWHFITDFPDLDRWEEEIMPYLESLENQTGLIEDWGSFDWGGRVCFRYDHVLIMDESLFKIGRILPPLQASTGEPLLNNDHEWLFDTIYLKDHYEECVHISLEQFIKICKVWMKLLND